MDSLKKMTANVFSKKPESESATPVAPTFDYKYIVGILVLVGLVYYLRDHLYSFYELYVADSARRMFGETMLKMHLSPTGDFVSTYVPDLSKIVGLSAAASAADVSVQEVGLDSLGI